VAEKEIHTFGADWALLTYGLLSKDAKTLLTLFSVSQANLKVCAHFCPVSETGVEFVRKDAQGKYVP
jgi:hypothetical protein